jgi:hypothetical protein
MGVGTVLVAILEPSYILTQAQLRVVVTPLDAWNI